MMSVITKPYFYKGIEGYKVWYSKESMFCFRFWS